MPIDALSVSCAQLTRDLLAIAKFLSNYLVHQFDNRRTDGRTDRRKDGQTNGQVENIMPTVRLDWRGYFFKNVQYEPQASIFIRPINKHTYNIDDSNAQGQSARKAYKAQHCWPPWHCWPPGSHTRPEIGIYWSLLEEIVTILSDGQTDRHERTHRHMRDGSKNSTCLAARKQ